MAETPKGVKPYDRPAAGWDALKITALAVRDQMGADSNARALLEMNQPDGFDCPGCAWPDPKHTSSFEFCENGAKAVTWEATVKRVDPAFFAQHTVTELYGWHDHDLENAGRLTEPLRYDAETDHFVPIGWDEAFQRIGTMMRAMDNPDRMEFYTSGRASNEAAFLYQLLARAYGTNNFPDCSNMCHEATSVGLPKSIGVGKGTVTLEDFDHADALFCIGHNPGTNHPRMLTTLREVARRGVPIIVANPLKERGLERFESPQDPVEMLTFGATRLASAYHQVKVGGDTAMFKGMMKALFDADRMNLATGGDGLLDRAFIAEHTTGFEALRDDIDATSWDAIERRSGLPRAELEGMARVYWQAERVIVCYGMGLTQHRHGTENVQQLANWMMLRGNVGRQGAGIAPLRGHSNVQGDRTVGITEIPGEAFLGRLDKAFGITSPRAKGHNAVEAVAAMRDGEAKGFIGLGGNLAVAMSDPAVSLAAFRNLELNVQICTKLNRTCLPDRQPGKHHPALPGPHRAGHAGDRAAIGDGRGQHVDGPRLARAPEARFARAALRAGDHRRHRQGRRARGVDRLGRPRGQLRPDPRQDPGGLSRFLRLQRTRPPSRRLPPAGGRHEPRMGHARPQGAFHRLSRHRRGRRQGRRAAHAHHGPQPRPV